MRLTGASSDFQAIHSSVTEPKFLSTDAALLDRIVDGDEAAIGSLYDQHSAVVYTIALRVLGSSEGAEDVLHEIFMQLWRQPTSFVIRDGSLRAALAVKSCTAAMRAQKGLAFRARAHDGQPLVS